LPRFVFVSGSETSCDAWSPVLDRIRKSGYTCCIRGLDEISWTHGVEAGIQTLVESIDGDPETVLVGHSVAGLLLPSMGEALGASSQVYIAALIPQPGRSVFDRLFTGEEIFSRSWAEGYEGIRRSENPLITHRSFLEWHLFHDCPPASVEHYWMKTDLPLREIYETTYKATEVSKENRHFIVCSGDRTLRPESQRPTSELLSDASVAEIQTGHCPHIAAPIDLADLILSLTAIPTAKADCNAKPTTPIACAT
jgi:pimeloyl-ACP methyl ester carboxylesterase